MFLPSKMMRLLSIPIVSFALCFAGCSNSNGPATGQPNIFHPPGLMGQVIPDGPIRRIIDTTSLNVFMYDETSYDNINTPYPTFETLARAAFGDDSTAENAGVVTFHEDSMQFNGRSYSPDIQPVYLTLDDINAVWTAEHTRDGALNEEVELARPIVLANTFSKDTISLSSGLTIYYSPAENANIMVNTDGANYRPNRFTDNGIIQLGAADFYTSTGNHSVAITRWKYKVRTTAHGEKIGIYSSSRTLFSLQLKP
jgi:hypothetical protein